MQANWPVPKKDLDELVRFALKLEHNGNTKLNRDRWRSRLVRHPERYPHIIQQFYTNKHIGVFQQMIPAPVCIFTKTQQTILYVVVALYTGSTYEQMSSIDVFRGLSAFTPSPATFYRYIPIVKDAIDICVARSMEEARMQINTDRYVSFDSAWVHRRFSRQCFGALIDIITDKVIGYGLSVIQLPEHLHTKLDNWAARSRASNFTFKSGYPQGLEQKVFSSLRPILEENDMIIGIVKDNEHDPGGEIKKMASGKEVVVDLNHNTKHFRAWLIRTLKEHSCPHFYASLYFWMSHLLHDANTTQQEKLAEWARCLNHLEGDHSTCSHAAHQRYRSFAMSEEERQVIRDIVKKGSDYLKLSRPGLHTQSNESLHAIKAQLLSKNTSWKSSLPARLGIAVLKKNERDLAFIQIARELGLELPKVLVTRVLEKDHARELHRNHSHEPDVKSRKNKRRLDVRHALTKAQQDPLGINKRGTSSSSGSQCSGTQQTSDIFASLPDILTPSIENEDSESDYSASLW